MFCWPFYAILIIFGSNKDPLDLLARLLFLVYCYAFFLPSSLLFEQNFLHRCLNSQDIVVNSICLCHCGGSAAIMENSDLFKF